MHGDNAFKLGDYRHAIQFYQRSLIRYNCLFIHRRPVDQLLQRYLQWTRAYDLLEFRIILNLSLANMRAGEHLDPRAHLEVILGLDMFRFAITLDPNLFNDAHRSSYDAKAWHYLGLVCAATCGIPRTDLFSGLASFVPSKTMKAAISFFKKALELAPGNVGIQASLERFRDHHSWTEGEGSSPRDCAIMDDIIEEEEEEEELLNYRVPRTWHRH